MNDLKSPWRFASGQGFRIASLIRRVMQTSTDPEGEKMSKDSSNGGRNGSTQGGASKAGGAAGGRSGQGNGGGWPSGTGKPSGGGRSNAPASSGKK
jgi:hypothetical protein